MKNYDIALNHLRDKDYKYKTVDEVYADIETVYQAVRDLEQQSTKIKNKAISELVNILEKTEMAIERTKNA